MTTARAHTNIALIKYWGKKDEFLKIPQNSSISVTLDGYYTDTKVVYDDSLREDVLYIDDVLIEGKELKRVQLFMDEVRRRYNIKDYAYIYSFNHVYKAAGLASSASAFAALAKASTAHLNLSDIELSRLARFGSGSASRSIYKDFVIWNKGNTDEDSYAQEIEHSYWPEFAMIVCVVNQNEKMFSSNDAMRETVESSPFYQGWLTQTEKDILEMKEAIKTKDINKVGKIAQNNALRMHATLQSIGKWYYEPDTIKIMNIVRHLQQDIPVYFTMDAGPNVKLITLDKYVDDILNNLKDYETVVCHQGPGVYVYED